MEQLKPCPFCGEDVKICQIDYEDGFATGLGVRCNCGANIIIRGVKLYAFDEPVGISAVDRWNRRADDETDRWRVSNDSKPDNNNRL